MRAITFSILFITISNFGYTQTLTDSLKAWYTNNGNALDMSGNGNDGNVNGATLTTDRFGNINSAYSFNGVSNNIELPSDFDYPEKTIALWFNATTIGTTTGGIYNSDHNSITFGLTGLNVKEVAGVKRLAYRQGATGGYDLDGFITENQWYMASISIRTDSTFFYLCDSLIFSLPTDLGNSNNGNSFASFGKSRVNDRYFDGKIDDVRIYNRALSSTEISELCKEGFCYQTVYDTVAVYDTISVYDTTFITVNDTVAVYDTTYTTINDTVVIYDTTLVSVTDTLIIDVLTGLVPPDGFNRIKVYPNPATDVLTIDNGNYTLLNNYSIEIKDNIGVQVFFGVINQQSFVIDISQWAKGLYFIRTFNPSSLVVDTRKIVLQ